MRNLRGMRPRLLRACVAAGLAVLLGACATRPPLRGVHGACALDYRGRISVVEQGPRAHDLYGSFALRLDGDGGRLELASPLGQVLMRASWNADAASVDDGRTRRSFPSFEDMTQVMLGVRLPRTALRDWLRGRPAAALPWRALSQGGFEQLGWQVHLRRRAGVPYILRLQRRQGDDLQRLSLVIDTPAAASPDAPCMTVSRALAGAAASAP